MAVLKCKMCGGNLEVAADQSYGTCDSCGSTMTLPKVNDERILNLFNRANHYRRQNEFDKALASYESILEEDANNAEAYWGCVLSRYGIEYVEDGGSHKRIPTCHRVQNESILADLDYQNALKYAPDQYSKELYQEEAEKISNIQKGILNIARNEKPYDIFICYKETDANGQRTIDSTIAQDIYFQLTNDGYKVFFSRITLEDKLGQEYEPYIFAALNSAKVMLVIGTKVEYFNAIWVKNEWARFLELTKKDREKLIIPCYRDIDAYQIPDELSMFQSQDMSKIGFIQDLIRGIKKVTQVGERKTAVAKETIVTGGHANTASLLKRAFIFLEDGDWNSANEYCEKVLDVDPECAQSYLGKLMAELHVRKQEDLKDQAESFASNNNYQKAVRFADKKLEDALTGYIAYINTRNENACLDNIYNRAKNVMNIAENEEVYKEAAHLFETISDYEDSAALAQECYKKAEFVRKDATLSDAKAKMTGEVVSNYESAIKLFESISGWKDADEKIYACKKKIEEINAKAEADRLERERQAELAREIAENRAKYIKKIAIIITPIVCVIIMFIIILNSVIIPNGKYNDAIDLMNAGKYTEAISVFKELDGYKDSENKISDCSTAILDSKYNNAIDLMNTEKYTEAISVFKELDGYKDSKNKINDCNTKILDNKYNDAIALIDTGNIVKAYETLVELDGYKDSAEKANSIYGKYEVEKIKSAKVKVGDTVFFGSYEQDNNTSNGKEDVEWLVLEVKDGKILVISKNILDCIQYHTCDAGVPEITWEACVLRNWLNNDFVNAVFSASEKEMIPTVTVSADNNPNYSKTNAGNATQDKVFLLSITEADKYFSSDIARKCECTDYAIAKGGKYYVDHGWWLRSPGQNQRCAAYVGKGGHIDSSGNAIFWVNFVRPVLWIDLNS